MEANEMKVIIVDSDPYLQLIFKVSHGQLPICDDAVLAEEVLNALPQFFDEWSRASVPIQQAAFQGFIAALCTLRAIDKHPKFLN
jgi:hypothetical protein